MAAGEEGREHLPKKIYVMADYGCEYGHDEHGNSLSITASFPGITGLPELEQRLEKWSVWFSASAYDERGFPWDAFNEEGMKLAQELADLMVGTDVAVSYRRPYEDASRRDMEEIVVRSGRAQKRPETQE